MLIKKDKYFYKDKIVKARHGDKYYNYKFLVDNLGIKKHFIYKGKTLYMKRYLYLYLSKQEIIDKYGKNTYYRKCKNKEIYYNHLKTYYDIFSPRIKLRENIKEEEYIEAYNLLLKNKSIFFREDNKYILKEYFLSYKEFISDINEYYENDNKKIEGIKNSLLFGKINSILNNYLKNYFDIKEEGCFMLDNNLLIKNSRVFSFLYLYRIKSKENFELVEFDLCMNVKTLFGNLKEGIIYSSKDLKRKINKHKQFEMLVINKTYSTAPKWYRKKENKIIKSKISKSIYNQLREGLYENISLGKYVKNGSWYY